jgi:hypothetical protein
MKRKKGSSAPYEVGYRRPPKKYQFQKGHSGNPTGTNRKPARSPDFKASLERELTKPISVKHGKRKVVVTQEAAGTSEMVRQFVKGDARARRDLIQLCDKYGINLTHHDALKGAIEEALSAEDEALLADFVRRHGGRYPVHGADDRAELPTKDDTLLGPPAGDPKLLPGPSENSSEPQTMKRRETNE